MQTRQTNALQRDILTTIVAEEQIAVARNARRREADFSVWLSPIPFRVLWFTLAMMHILCIGCFGIQCWVYKMIPSTYFASSLQEYDVTMSPANFHVVSNVFGVITLVHCLLLLEMLIATMWYRKCSFTIMYRRRRRGTGRKRQRNSGTLATESIRIINLVIGERGFLGVKDHHFAVIYVVRKIFETILQSIQAFRMSQFIPRMLVNRFFVVTIVTNCWSTPVIKHLFKHNSPLERLLCLMFDIALDFTSTVGVPVVLAVPYWSQYDFEASDFPYDLYWSDFWLVNMINELRIALVSSWANLMSELIFSVSLLICLQDVKHLLRSYPSASTANKLRQRKWFGNTVLPIEDTSDQSTSKLAQCASATVQYQTCEHKGTNRPTTAMPLRNTSSRFVNTMHAFMIFWGLSLLVTHLQASFRSVPTQCGQQAWPWFGTKAGCTLLRINCNRTIENSGSISEFDMALAQLDEHTLNYIVIRHCSQIEVPPRLQQFPNLIGIKIYNSTLAHWDLDAAITRTHHPKMVFLFVVKTNMTEIPLGVLSPDFPSKIKDIEFAWTNLTTLPDNLTDIWPRDGFIMLERSQFLSIPQTLLLQSDYQVSLAGGIVPILPREVFTNPMASQIWISGNPITELPVTLMPSKSIQFIELSNTLLQSLPSWMDAGFFKYSYVSAGGTPLCDKLEPIIASGDNNSVTPDLVVARAAYELGRFSCWTGGSYFYPYDAEALQ